MNVEGVFTMDLKLVKEHEDGSATYSFDMSDEERLALIQLGIVTALKAGIEEGKKYDDVEASSSL
jgi:hypothetical protein